MHWNAPRHTMLPPTRRKIGPLAVPYSCLGESKAELAVAEIQFDPKLTSEEFWKYLVEGMKKKYGTKFDTPSTRTATWTNSDFKTAELTEETNYEADPPNSFFSISIML